MRTIQEDGIFHSRHNIELYEIYDEPTIIGIRTNRVRWTGNVKSLREGRVPKSLLLGVVQESKVFDEVVKDIHRGLDVNCQSTAIDRERQRKIVEQTKTRLTGSIQCSTVWNLCIECSTVSEGNAFFRFEHKYLFIAIDKCNNFNTVMRVKNKLLFSATVYHNRYADYPGK